MDNRLSTAFGKLTDAKSCLIIAAVCLFSFFINNNLIPADLMEARNLATAQEMVREGNYLIPTMNGELRLEKPPLPTWIAAGVEHIMPDNLAAQRSMAGIAATAMALFLYLLVRKMTGEYLPALISAVVLVTSFNVITMGRTATWDIYCHSFMLAAIYLIVRAFESSGSQWRRFIGAGILMGLSFMSKGPISFYALLLPFLIAYVLVFRPEVKGKLLPVCGMIVVCLAVSFWWPCYIAIFQPQTGLAVANKESLNWLDYHTRPLWYYWQFAAEAGIWALFWITALIYFFRSKKTEDNRVFRFSIIWTIAAFILLSLVPEKKTRYLLPMLIPGAMNVGFYIWYSIRGLSSKGEHTLFRINGLVIAVITLAMPVLIYMTHAPEGVLGWSCFGISSVIFIALAIWLIAGIYGRKGILPARIFAGTVMVMLTFLVFCFRPVVHFFVNNQRHSIHALRNNPNVEGLAFYHSLEEEVTMQFVYESNHNILPLDIRNDSVFYAALPFVLVSTDSPGNILQGRQVEIEYIDTFDNNWRQPGHKRYNKNMVKQVAVVRCRPDISQMQLPM